VILGNRPYRVAIGAEWVKDQGDAEKVNGADADLIAPLAGVALLVGDISIIHPIMHDKQRMYVPCSNKKLKIQ